MAIGEFTRTMSAENPLGKIIFDFRRRLFEPLKYPEFFHYSGCDDVNPHPELEDIYRKFGRVHITRVVNERKIERKIVIETVVIDYSPDDSGKYRSVTLDFNENGGTINDIFREKQRRRGSFSKQPPPAEITRSNILIVEDCVKQAEIIYKAIGKRYMESRKKQVRYRPLLG